MTVRAESPRAEGGRRAGRRSAAARRAGARARGRSRSKVSSTEIEMRSARELEAARVDPVRAVAEHAPDLAGEQRAQVERRRGAASAPTVVTPAAARRCSARGPTPGSARTGYGARKRGLGPGRHDRDPARLAPVGRDLRDDLRRRDAERAGQARRRPHRGLDGLGDRARAREVGREPGEVEVALVEPGALDPRHDLAHGRPDRLRVVAVQRVPGPEEDRLRAAPERLGAAHRRVDAEAPRDVVRGRDDAAAARVAADDERLRAGAPAARAPRPRRRRRRGRGGRESP